MFKSKVADFDPHCNIQCIAGMMNIPWHLQQTVEEERECSCVEILHNN